jgi:hypothetical protein
MLRDANSNPNFRLPWRPVRAAAAPFSRILGRSPRISRQPACCVSRRTKQDAGLLVSKFTNHSSEPSSRGGGAPPPVMSNGGARLRARWVLCMPGPRAAAGAEKQIMGLFALGHSG